MKTFTLLLAITLGPLFTTFARAESLREGARAGARENQPVLDWHRVPRTRARHPKPIFVSAGLALGLTTAVASAALLQDWSPREAMRPRYRIGFFSAGIAFPSVGLASLALRSKPEQSFDSRAASYDTSTRRSMKTAYTVVSIGLMALGSLGLPWALLDNDGPRAGIIAFGSGMAMGTGAMFGILSLLMNRSG